MIQIKSQTYETSMDYIQKKKITRLLEKMESEVSNDFQIYMPCVQKAEKKPKYGM